MITGPVRIAGVKGAITVHTNFWTGQPTVYVDGQPAPRTARRTFQLPAPKGKTVVATVRKVPFWKPVPVIEIDGVRHLAGPEVPAWMSVLVVLPIVLIYFGLLGALLGLIGVLTNMTLTGINMHIRQKGVLMVGNVLLSAMAIWLIEIAFAGLPGGSS